MGKKGITVLRCFLQTSFTLVFALSMLVSGGLWNKLSGAFSSVQFIPLFLRSLGPGAVTALSMFFSIIICTVIFGRFYCSVLCPLGSVMDASSWLNRKKKYRYAAPRHTLQTAFFFFVVITASLGLPLFLDWVEPYGIFARGVRIVFRPLYAGFIALWNIVAKASGSYGPDPVKLENDIPVLVISAVFFISAAAVSFFNGRLFCRTLCPTGAVLELASTWPLFGLSFENSCTKCRACEKACPSSCIDIGRSKIDSGRCVLCLACLDACNASSIKYGRRSRKKPPESEAASLQRTISRRSFLAVAGTGTLALVIPSIIKKMTGLAGESGQVTLSGISRSLAVAPGAVSQERYARFCTGCGLCVSRCPTGVLRHLFPALGKLPHSVGGFQPFLDYSRAYCTYDCVACNQVCPTGALLRLTPEAKRTVAVGESRFERVRCIVITMGTPCGACAEHCPTGAVTMRAIEIGKPTEPVLEPDLCVGCGACEKICPAVPAKAIWVSGLAKHKTVRLPSGGSTDEGNSGFGF